jgi:hypothetical protein
MSIHGDVVVDAEIASSDSPGNYSYEMIYKDDSEKLPSSRMEIERHAVDEEKTHQPDNLLIVYYKKFLGVEGKSAPPMQKIFEMIISSVLAFTGIVVIAITDYYYLSVKFEVNDLAVKLLAGAYGATSGIEMFSRVVFLFL